MEEENLIKKVVDETNKTNIEYFLTDKGKSLNKNIYDLVIFTLDNNKELYDEKTIDKIKQGFKNN